MRWLPHIDARSRDAYLAALRRGDISTTAQRWRAELLTYLRDAAPWHDRGRSYLPREDSDTKTARLRSGIATREEAAAVEADGWCNQCGIACTKLEDGRYRHPSILIELGPSGGQWQTAATWSVSCVFAGWLLEAEAIRARPRLRSV